ncbi:MAG: hypothetical protein AB7F89_21215, partial [Pirellulaceae bacterium]
VYADGNGSGAVDLFDMSILAASFGQALPAEPPLLAVIGDGEFATRSTRLYSGAREAADSVPFDTGEAPELPGRGTAPQCATPIGAARDAGGWPSALDLVIATETDYVSRDGEEESIWDITEPRSRSVRSTARAG